MRMRLIALILLGYLASAALAKADAVYTFNAPGDYSWSFDVPSIITTNTMITSFLTTNIVPTSILVTSFGCTSIDSASIDDPSSPGATIETHFGGCPLTQPTTFDSPINSFGTFTAAGRTLTIAPSAGVPEPSSLLLLGAGLSAFG